MSAIPFRLRPCLDSSAAANDALTFGNPWLYDKLATLGRIEIQAEVPRVRAGTIWYRIDQQYCFIEAVAIREGMYPLVYKVLPAMVAAQLGFPYVGRYFNMTYTYANRSLVWDEKEIEENGARSYASVYPGMTPIVKLTAIMGGSSRTPVVVRDCMDSTAAADDAVSLGDSTLTNRLVDLARLEVVAGSDGTRAGTIWYFRNGNYCFVVASYLRPSAPAGLDKLLPLLSAQHFGYRYVGNYSAIPADLKAYSLCWDRFTGSPIPTLAPISERLPAEIDFVVTFADSPPPTTNPDPDPYPDNCESTSLHYGETGWNYDGCHWNESPSPGEDYYWTENPDNLGGYWTQNSTPNDPPSSPGDGYNWDGYNWNYESQPSCDYGASWSPPAGPIAWGVLSSGSWSCNPPPPPPSSPGDGYNWDGYNWNYESQPSCDYGASWSPPAGPIAWGNSSSGSWSCNPPPSYPPYGTLLNSSTTDITVNLGCGDWVTGTNSSNEYADGNGGSYAAGGTSYVGYGTYLGNCNDYNYYADGNGGYYQGEYTGM